MVLVDIHAADSSVVQEAKEAVKKANNNTNCIYIRTDVTKEEQVEQAVQQCVQEFGRLDYAANFAGILGPLAPSWETKTEEWRQVLEVNAFGVWLCMKHELAQMIKQEPIVAEAGLDPARQQQRGSIVNAASVNSIQAGPGVTGYTAAKHAVLGKEYMGRNSNRRLHLQFAWHMNERDIY